MVKVIERIMRRLFPELFSGYHLPMLAKVLAIADPPTGPALVDEFRPHFAVNIQILNANGTINKKLPVYKGVPLPAQMAGLDQGMWGFPHAGAIVEVAFAYGNPAKPFIRTILSIDATTPSVKKGEQVWQHSPGIEQRADTAGNWTRTTDKDITDTSTTRLIESLQCVQNYLQSTIEVSSNSTETIGATKHIEAMGAIKLMAGEQALLLALKDLKLASNKVLRTYSKENTEVTTDIKLITNSEDNTEINTNAEFRAIANTLAHIQANEVWLGSDSVNAIQILVDLIQVVSDLADTMSTHTHPHGTPNTTAPVQAGAITGHKSAADALKSTLEPITE
jgi:hypothetical protein